MATNKSLLGFIVMVMLVMAHVGSAARNLIDVIEPIPNDQLKDLT